VPVISRLEQGKYYLQLGAFSRAEAVELELARIGGAYPLAVQNGGSPENPVYRILLGPVTPGESGALLRRFKGSGYGDAFIRQDG
jgi:cell division septation protein DedD